MPRPGCTCDNCQRCKDRVSAKQRRSRDLVLWRQRSQAYRDAVIRSRNKTDEELDRQAAEWLARMDTYGAQYA